LSFRFAVYVFIASETLDCRLAGGNGVKPESALWEPPSLPVSGLGSASLAWGKRPIASACLSAYAAVVKKLFQTDTVRTLAVQEYLHGVRKVAG
jgi:hypothetical protein